jgi:RNA polymerase sigma factor (sigma-70 family)
VFASDPWYQHELATAARRVVIESGAALDLVGDVAQEAFLILGRDLRRDGSLNCGQTTDDAGFGRWMRTIIVRQCRQSLRRVGRTGRRETEIHEEDCAVDLIPRLELCLDVYGGVEQLSREERTVVLLHTQGATFHQIAEQLGQPYQTVYSIWRRALEHLRHTLDVRPG